MLTALYYIWYTVYRVNFQHKTYWFTHLTYVVLLQYLGKQVECIMIIFSRRPNLHITVAKSKTTSSLSAQSVCIQVQLLQQVFKMSSFFIHTDLKSLPFINSVVHNALRQAIPCVYQVLSQICYVLNWHLIHTILHDAPYSAVNRNMIRTIRRPEVWRNEFRSFTLK